ncbi:MAG: TonB-dependent receptor [Novosphingobium sp.]|uniref:TonB-dependent receptor plug domain-containing protein n=1 Tax=Novosphingobium sp. TaxID=1874826 RepID=UPI0032B9D4BA
MQTTASRRSRKVALAATAATLAIFLTDPALAQDAGAADDAAAAAPEETLVVIGTRRTDRTITDSASPVDVISASDLQNQPSSNMLDTVKNVVPSFFVGQNSISDASTFVRAPSLRGLPADQVLVMLNGKRLNRSALVQVYSGGDTGLSFGSQGSDISSIPAISVKNLQVLRDGATAQYGSDAIAGVLNYELRSDAGIEVGARYGQYYDKGDGKSYQLSGYFGFKLGDSGSISLSGEYNDDGQTSRGQTRPLAVSFAANNPSLAHLLPHYPDPAQIWGNSPSTSYKVMLNSKFEMSDSAELYLFANVAHSEADQSFNYRAPQSVAVGFSTTAGTTGSLNGNGVFRAPYYLTQCTVNPACIAAGGYIQNTNIWNATSLYPAGFTPRFVGVVDEATGTAGIRGDSGKLHYDLSATLARNSLDLSMYNSISPSYGPLSKTSFNFGTLIQKEITVNFDGTYDLDAGLASPLVLSFGAEYRRESYTATEGDVQSYGAGPWATPHPLYTPAGVLVGTSADCTVAGSVCTRAQSPAASGYGGTSPTYAGTNTDNSYGAYVGLEGDLSDRLSMGIAGRYEHYQSSGDAVVGKVNALFKVSEELSLRGTVGTGYHAPSPGQNNTQILTTNFVAGQSVQTGTFPVTSAIAQFYGGVPLKPEKSTNFGLGFVFQPSNAITLTVDAYSIKVTDRIFISQANSVTAAHIIALPELASVGVGGDVNFFTNALDTRTQGVDVVGTYRTSLGEGKLNLTLAYNHNKNKVTRFIAGTISAGQISDAENLAPKHRLNMMANWSVGPLSINLTEHFYSSWRAEQDYPGQLFGSKWTTDFDISYTFDDHYTFSFGASNLFNAYPDRIAASASNPIYTITNSTADGQVYPRNGGPFGFNGGFWYGRVRIKF